MKRKFRVGQQVGLLWEKTPYSNYTGELLKVGVIKRLPYRGSKLFEVDNVNSREPTRIYQFYAEEMITLSSPALNGDVL